MHAALMTGDSRSLRRSWLRQLEAYLSTGTDDDGTRLARAHDDMPG